VIERVFIKQGIKKVELERYLKKELDGAGFTHLDIVKTPLVTRIVLNVTHPGLAIGKGGKNIRRLTEEIGEQFGFENPQLEIKEIENPELNAKAMVDKMTSLIERGFSWRSVAFRSVRDIQSAGAQGIELVFSGKLAGKGGRKRKHRIASGYMKKVGAQTELVDYAKASAYPKAGAIGIKLRIIRPEVVFPDKVNIADVMSKEEPKEETVAKTVEKETSGKEVEKKEKEVKQEKTGSEKKEEKEKPETDKEKKAGKEDNKNKEKKEKKKENEKEEEPKKEEVKKEKSEPAKEKKNEKKEETKKENKIVNEEKAKEEKKTDKKEDKKE